jgi:hypothetical protein
MQAYRKRKEEKTVGSQSDSDALQESMRRHPAGGNRSRMQELEAGIRRARERLSPEELGAALHGVAVIALMSTVRQPASNRGLFDSDEPVEEL